MLLGQVCISVVVAGAQIYTDDQIARTVHTHKGIRTVVKVTGVCGLYHVSVRDAIIGQTCQGYMQLPVNL